MSTFTDKLVNRLTPDQQISSLLSYQDTISEAEKAIIAEKVGVSVASGSNGTDGAGLNEFVDATYAAFSAADAQRWIRVYGSSNGNDGFYYITKFVNSTKVEISPSLAASETGLTWTEYKEPSLQDDLNVAITQLREIIYPAADWFQPMPRGFDPANTDVSDTKNEKISLKVLADNWYGSKTKITDVITTAFAAAAGDGGKLWATGLGYADVADRRGLIIQSSSGNTYYDEVALASIIAGKHKVMLEDAVNGDEFEDSAGNVIYGVLQDGLDNLAEESTATFSQAGSFYDVIGAAKAIQLYDGTNAGHYFWFSVTGGANVQTDPVLVGTGHVVAVLPGDTSAQVATKFAAVVDGLAQFVSPVPGGSVASITNAAAGVATDISATGSAAAVAVVTQGTAPGVGEGTDVFIKYVHDVGGVPTAYSWTSANPVSIKAYLPYRKKASEMTEYEDRRVFVSSIVGDAETHEDVANLWAMLGVSDSQTAGDWDWTNTAAFYPLQNDPATAEGAINDLNNAIGDRQYTQNNYLTDGQTITASLDALDVALATAGVRSKILERVVSTITRGTVHTIPFASGSNPSIVTYKLDTGYRGLYMDIYVGGKKLIPDSSAVAQDGEYAETSTTSFTPRFTIPIGQVIEYVIRDDA